MRGIYEGYFYLKFVIKIDSNIVNFEFNEI
jgi:hypothetical protein